MKKDIKRIKLHIDKASSHTSKLTTLYLKKRKLQMEMKYVAFEKNACKISYASL